MKKIYYYGFCAGGGFGSEIWLYKHQLNLKISSLLRANIFHIEFL